MWNSSLRETDSPLRIGLTGGIGSGKSIISTLFRILGIAVFEADQWAKQIISEDVRVKEELVRLFGEAICLPDGGLNRKHLASVIFRDPLALQQVNGIVHPMVKAAFDNWYIRCKGPYVLMEAAILFESGFNRFMNATILVTAPEELRVARVLKRDGISEEDVRIRMKNQFREEESAGIADYIIRNDGMELVIPQVLEIDKRLRVSNSPPAPL